MKKILIEAMFCILMLSGCAGQSGLSSADSIQGNAEAGELRQTVVSEACEAVSLPRKLGAYLLPETILEMGDMIEPADFFDLEALWEDFGLSREDLHSLSFVKALEEQQLYCAGSYEVQISTGETILKAHLTVQDTIAPIITAPEAVAYYVGESILYKKDVSVWDNSGEILEIEVDSHEVFSNIPGQYPVYYYAKDSSQNEGVAVSTITILQGHVATEEEAAQLAEELLHVIITEDMEPLEQAKAIFDWCHENIQSAANATKEDMIQGVYDGIHYKVGDCYTYFATSSYLLSACGIDNLPVSRKSDDITHYWSLVNIGNGWYHFDCFHQLEGFKCFMQTDAQVKAYSEEVRRMGSYYRFDESDMPERAVEIIYENQNFCPSIVNSTIPSF